MFENKNAAGYLPSQFTDAYGRPVLTANGRAGMHGMEGVGSTTERALSTIASILFTDGPSLDAGQLDAIVRWVGMCRSGK